jgi:hypothetical protein
MFRGSYGPWMNFGGIAMIDFLTAFSEIFLYPVSLMMDYENPLYYGMIAILVTAGIVSVVRRLLSCMS